MESAAFSKRVGSNYRIPDHRIYIYRCALKKEVYNNSCFLMQSLLTVNHHKKVISFNLFTTILQNAK